MELEPVEPLQPLQPLEPLEPSEPLEPLEPLVPLAPIVLAPLFIPDRSTIDPNMPGRVVPRSETELVVMRGWTGTVATDVGDRLHNEDGYGWADLDETWSVAFVLDGHGGNRVMLIVQDNLVPLLRKALMTKTPRDALTSVFHQLTDLCTFTSGTCVAGVLLGPQTIVFHLGDCRVVTPTGATVDHKPSEPSERARIEAAGGYISPAYKSEQARVNGTLAVSRALGDSQEAFVSKDVDMMVLSDAAIVIASDGVWDLVTTEHARDMLALNATATDFLKAAAASSDNSTALVLYRNVV